MGKGFTSWHLLSRWPWGCGGVEPGIVTASSSWSFRSATSEPSRFPRHAGFSDAPEAMMLCPWALVKAEGVSMGVRCGVRV